MFFDEIRLRVTTYPGQYGRRWLLRLGVVVWGQIWQCVVILGASDGSKRSNDIDTNSKGPTRPPDRDTTVARRSNVLRVVVRFSIESELSSDVLRPARISRNFIRRCALSVSVSTGTRMFFSRFGRANDPDEIFFNSQVTRADRPRYWIRFSIVRPLVSVL